MTNITEPPVIPNLSLPVPSRLNPETFSERMDRTLLEIPETVDGINATAIWFRDNVGVANDQLQAVIADAVSARASASAAAASAASSADSERSAAALVALTGGELDFPSFTAARAPLIVNDAKTAAAFDSRTLNKGANVRPSLRFDFINQKRLDPRLKFTRPSADWGFDETGAYRKYEINEPVFDYDPESGEAKGLRVFGQRTNIYSYSSDLTNPSSSSNLTITEDKLEVIESGERASVEYREPGIGGDENAVTVWFKDETTTGFSFRVGRGHVEAVRIRDGEIVSSGSIVKDAVIESAGEFSILRFLVTPDEPESSNQYVRVDVGDTSAVSGESVSIFMIDIKKDGFSAPIPTEGSAVTVAESKTRGDLTGLVNARSGSFIYERTYVAPKYSSFDISFGESGGNCIAVNYNSSIKAYFYPATPGGSAIINGGLPNRFDPSTVAVRYEVVGNSVRFSMCNAGVKIHDEVLDRDPELLKLWDSVSLGARYDAFRRGMVFGGFSYYPRALSDEALIALTS